MAGKRIFLTFVLLASSTLALSYGRVAAQEPKSSSPFSGSWQISGMSAQITLVVDGTTATGSVSDTAIKALQMPITSGTVNGNTLVFTVESPNGLRTLTFRATLNAGYVVFTRSTSRGDASAGFGIFAGESAEFTASSLTRRGVIAGRIVDKVSNRPIENATVNLWLSGDPDTPYDDLGDRLPPTAMTKTAPDGSFAAGFLLPGVYGLEVTMDHYLNQSYGQRVVGGNGKSLNVLPGERFEHVDFRLTKESVIAGTVLGPDGSPMPNVEVQAYARRRTTPELPYDGGKWRLNPVGTSTRTDESGRYRLGNMEPGDYYMRARPTAQPRSSGEVYVPEFYPGGSDAAMVSPVHVPVGAEIRGIDFALRSTRPSRVTGTVLRATSTADGVGRETAEPVRVNVGLYPIGLGSNLTNPTAMVPSASAIVETRPDGTFECNGILPGAYRVLAVGMQSNRRVTAIQDLYVQAGSAPTLSLALQFGVDVPGQIVVKGPVPPGFQLDTQQITIQMADRLPGLSQQLPPRFTGLTRVRPDGSFVVRDAVPDASHQILRAGTLTDNYVSEIRYGGSDVFATWVVPKKGDAKLELVLEFGHGRVEVKVMDGDRPQANIATLLVPKQRDYFGFYKPSRSDAEGRAAFFEIFPGDYEVFAFEDMRPGSVFEPGFLEQFEGRGRSIHVEKGKTYSETIPLIRMEGP